MCSCRGPSACKQGRRIYNTLLLQAMALYIHGPLQGAYHSQAVRCGTTIGAASSVFVCTKPLALQGLVGQHPKPFDRAAPAGCCASAARFCRPQQNRYMTKPPDRDSACLRAFLLLVGKIPCGGSIRALAAPAGLCRAVREVHNGDLCHGLFDRLQDVLYLLHRVS